MISVLICEDNPYYMELISKCVKDYIMMEAFDMDLVICTPAPNEIIKYIKNRTINGLYFLDVELEDNKSGIDLAREIRKYDPRGFIAFITAHPQYLQTTFEYRVEAMAYIQKTADTEIVKEKICGCIKNAYDKYVARAYDNRFIFKSINGRMISCEYGDILFFETDPQKGTKRLILHTKRRQYAFYGTISELIKTLPKGQFFKCHKSSLVNINNITSDCTEDLEQGKDYIIMPDGTECYVAVRKRKELLKMIPRVTGTS